MAVPSGEVTASGLIKVIFAQTSMGESAGWRTSKRPEMPIVGRDTKGAAERVLRKGLNIHLIFWKQARGLFPSVRAPQAQIFIFFIASNHFILWQ